MAAYGFKFRARGFGSTVSGARFGTMGSALQLLQCVRFRYVKLTSLKTWIPRVARGLNYFPRAQSDYGHGS